MTKWRKNILAALGTIIVLAGAAFVFQYGRITMYTLAYEDQVRGTFAQEIDAITRYQIKRMVAMEVRREWKKLHAGSICYPASDINFIEGQDT